MEPSFAALAQPRRGTGVDRDFNIVVRHRPSPWFIIIVIVAEWTGGGFGPMNGPAALRSASTLDDL